ncbi:MAG: DoxX family protein [Kangiellaceae bacterium]|nr:DoxX family protein [Kangiellaceae bacterium]
MLKTLLNYEDSLLGKFRFSHSMIHYGPFLLSLLLKGWIFYVFFFSGWVKFTSWSTTLMLFEYEYTVPLVSPLIAAFLATAVELIFPTLLLAGLIPRTSAIVIGVLNLIACYSYADISAAGIQQHIMWGIMLLTLFVIGNGVSTNGIKPK